ncbi:MAG: 4-carboxymuconolactone decarboxylase, partial [uncultured Frankineae bacterium]
RAVGRQPPGLRDAGPASRAGRRARRPRCRTDDRPDRAVPGPHHPLRLGRRLVPPRARPPHAQLPDPGPARGARPRGRAGPARPGRRRQRPDRRGDRRGAAAHGRLRGCPSGQLGLRGRRARAGRARPRRDGHL